MLDGAEKNFGFGCMRLKLLENGEVDFDNFKEMIDIFLENGFNYFDTAHGYINYKKRDGNKRMSCKALPERPLYSCK